MKPIRTPTTNTVLGQPADWDAAQNGVCEGLPIAVGHHGTMFSYWRPDWREILDIVGGRPIRLGVFGSAHPPVTIDTEH